MDESRESVEWSNVSGRDIAALLNPRPAVLVTTCDAIGRPNVMTAVWHTPLAHDPPLVGVSIGTSRYSHTLIRATHEFIIHIVGREMIEAVEICGNHSGATRDKFALAALAVQPALCVRAPVLADALGDLECRVVQAVACGDHTFFIARVLEARARRDSFLDAWDVTRGEVLLCRQRDRFGRCAAEGTDREPRPC